MVPADPSDLLVTLDAEDSFDVEADLPRITAPTLVIGGSKDNFYTEELFRRTAAGVQDGRVHLFPEASSFDRSQPSPSWGHPIGESALSSARA
jgi:pimeloyl-ACP methyl ester carboxylesterase